MDLNSDEILKYLAENDIINVAAIEQSIELKKKQKYINEHGLKIWQGKNGYWYTYVPDVTKPDGRKLIRRADKEKLLDAVGDHYKEQEETPTFSALFNRWIEEKLKFGEICKGTYDRYLQDYARFFYGEQFAEKRIRLITESEIEELIKKKIHDFELKRRGFSNLRILIMGTFKYAKKYGYTNISISSFFGDLELSSRIFKPSTLEGKQVFDEDEIDKIITYLETHPDLINYGILLDFRSGLRTGELSALKISDFDAKGVLIQRQEVKFRGEDGHFAYEVVEYTKTENGTRYVELPDKALKTVAALRRMNPFGNYIFEVDGKKYKNGVFSRRLKKICRELGIPERSMHKIRKTYGTTLIDGGVDKSLVISQMGHKDYQTTEEYYHFANKNSQHVREQINNAVRF